MKTFENKVVIVTGAASGIGRASALQFAAEGANVILADIDEVGLKEVADMIGDKALAINVNVADMASCQSMVDLAVEKFGRLDVMFSNAGISGDRALTDQQSQQSWQRVIDINLNGVFYCTKAAIPHLQKSGGGVIINTASVDGLVGCAELSPYVATKHAVMGLTKTVALEYGRDNIRCVAIAPGFVKTHMTSDNFSEEEGALLSTMVPCQRAGESDEIANMVLWLASDKASYVSGSFHQIDGGLLSGFSFMNQAT